MPVAAPTYRSRCLIPLLIAPISVHLLARGRLTAAGQAVPDRQTVIEAMTPRSATRRAPNPIDERAHMKSVVITGASTGIGRACALILDRNGFRVFAGVRKDSRRRRAALCGVGVAHTGAHRRDRRRVDHAMAEQVKAAVGEAGLAGLVNNAGTTLPCPVEYLPLDGFRRQLEVNLVGPLAVTQALLPMLRHGSGPRRQRHVGRRQGRCSADGAIRGCQAWPGRPQRRDAAGVPPIGRFRSRSIEPGFVATAMGGKLQRDTDATMSSLPDEGRRSYGPPLEAVAEKSASMPPPVHRRRWSPRRCCTR